MCNRPLAIVPILFVFVAIPSGLADETLYRYEGDVHPLDPSTGWVIGNPCGPPCSEFIEDGHFVFFWPVAGDLVYYAYIIYHRRTAGCPTPHALG